jgi:hypothetical protein
MEQVELIKNAIDNHAWYPLIGILVTLVIAGWKRLGPSYLTGYVSRKYQWLPPVVVAALTGFADAQRSGELWWVALVLAGYAAYTAGLSSIGLHHAAKRVAGQQPAAPPETL